MAIQWDGLTKSSSVKPEYSAARHDLAEAARNFDWPRVFDIFNESGLKHVNAWRLDGKSFFTPLHQAAYGNAPLRLFANSLLLAVGGRCGTPPENARSILPNAKIILSCSNALSRYMCARLL
jgi:hypothetical protein